MTATKNIPKSLFCEFQRPVGEGCKEKAGPERKFCERSLRGWNFDPPCA